MGFSSKEIFPLMVGVALIVAAAVGLPYFLSGKATTASILQVGGQPSGQAITCTSDTNPAIQFLGEDGITSVTIAGAPVLVREKGTQSWTTVYTNGATVNYNPGSQLEYGVANENASYYSLKGDYTVPCASTPKPPVKIYRAATVSSLNTYIDNPDGTKNSLYLVNDMGAGDVDNMKFSITGQYQRTYGDINAGANSNILAFRYNNSIIDTLNVGGLEAASTPVTLSVPTGYSTKSFKYPVLMGNTEQINTLSIDADDTNAPQNSTGNVVNATLFDSQLYLDATTTNNLFYGVEDENNVNLGVTGDLTLAFYIG